MSEVFPIDPILPSSEAQNGVSIGVLGIMAAGIYDIPYRGVGQVIGKIGISIPMITWKLVL